jgi:hypothetical protein
MFLTQNVEEIEKNFKDEIMSNSFMTEGINSEKMFSEKIMVRLHDEIILFYRNCLYFYQL